MVELSTRILAAANSRGTVRLTSESTGGSSVGRLTGVRRVDGSGLEFSVTTTAGGRTLKMIWVDDAAYMNVGRKYQGKNWVRISPEGKHPLSKALAPVFGRIGASLDVGSPVRDAQGSTITGATRAELNGRPVTKYTVVQSEQAFAAQLDEFATTPELRAQLRKQFKGARGETQMWLGDDDLPLRYETRVVGGTAPGTTTTVTYSDWGKPVTISAPPRSDVVDLSA
jgi:hypothetical protein